MNEIKGKMGCDNDIVEHVFLVCCIVPGARTREPSIEAGEAVGLKRFGSDFLHTRKAGAKR